VNRSLAETRFAMGPQPRLRVLPEELPETSPLAAARVRRRLTVEEAAARSGLAVEDVKRLEERRIYSFPSVDQAIGAALVYATAIGVSAREARELAGLPVAAERWSLRRWLAVLVFAAAAAVLGWFVVVPEVRPEDENRTAIVHPASQLPPPWEIRVDVFNGTKVSNAATTLANEIGGPLAYRIGTVENAERLDYVETRVYYPAGSEEIAKRLAGQLGLETAALPGRGEEDRLLVIVGRDRAGSG
jgi:LytR cell envelope-related transcriptional attenuator